MTPPGSPRPATATCWMWPSPYLTASAPRTNCFRGSIARPVRSLSTLRRRGHPRRRKTRFRLLASITGRVRPAGLRYKVSTLHFYMSSPLSEPPDAPGKTISSPRFRSSTPASRRPRSPFAPLADRPVEPFRSAPTGTANPPADPRAHLGLRGHRAAAASRCPPPPRPVTEPTTSPVGLRAHAPRAEPGSPGPRARRPASAARRRSPPAPAPLAASSRRSPGRSEGLV